MDLKQPDYSKGFTLIELLVVLAIMAIMSTIGITYYNGLQIRARDSVRKTYISELATALEVNKSVMTYQALQPGQLSMLASADPIGTVYCITPNIPPDPGFAVSWLGTCPAGFEVVAAGVPTTGPFTSFKVCTYLEQSGPNGTNVYCKSGTL